MLTHLEKSSSIADAIARRRVVADGPGDLSESWLEDGRRVAMPEESGRHLEADDCLRLASALRTADIHTLIAVANDPLVLDEMVYELAATAEDLAAFSSEFSGINSLLLPRAGTGLAVLFTTDDYHLVAGSREFVTAHVGDAVAARDAFRAFVDGHFEPMQPMLHSAERYMSWVGTG